ncbi:MAG: YncE family protein [Acidobacteriia bacterium]|nr:YncE family protein [Terriglobia bacterium]
MPLRKLAIIVCAAGLIPAGRWASAQEPGNTERADRGGRGRGPVQRQLLYAAVPGRVDDIGFGGVGILVFDAGRNFRFVKRISTWDYPAAQSPENVKGVAVSAPLGMIYVSTIKRLAAWDLLTEKKVWEQTYDGNCCDRMAVSPDGKTMYVPSFEGSNWYVVDAATGNLIKKLPTPDSLGAHNTIWSLDGSKVFMAGLRSKVMSIADPKTNTVVQTVGPFANNVRPFTVNGAGTLIYANVNDLLGFQIADVKSGKVVYTVQVQGYGWARERLTGHGCPSHGIALSPDEKEVWVTDGSNSSVHVFDNTVMPPKQIKSIKMRDEPFWLTWSADGKWAYSSSGDIIDAASKQVIAGLKDELGRDVQGEKAVEVIYQGGKLVKAVDQFGVGQVMGPRS